MTARDRNRPNLNRLSGRELLRTPMTDEERADAGRVSPVERIARRLSVDVPAARDLAECLMEDLDRTDGGVRWWGADVDQRAGILIFDHAVHAVAALPDLIVEARLHLMDLVDAWAGQEEKWRDNLANGRSPFDVPPNRSLLDDLDQAQDDLHLAGFFRALAQSLDCLAVAIIVILDLPTNIHRASWKEVRDLLKAHEAEAGPVGDAVRHLTEAREAGSPEGWLDWVLDMRNMVVHRPRLLDINQPWLLGGDLVLPGYDNFDRLRLVHHLTRAPERSLVESFVHAGGPNGAYLTEDGQVTLEHALDSTIRMVTASAEALQQHWETRRSDPALSPQRNCAKEWKMKAPPDRLFQGYAPGSIPIEPQAMVSNSAVGERLMAAGIGDDRRGEVWGEDAWSGPPGT